MAADELRETEQLLRATFQSSPVPIVITSLRDGVVRNVNDHFVQLTQYTPEDLVGKDASYRQQIGLIDPSERQAMLDRLKETQFIQGYEMQIKRKDGQVIDVLVSACIITINQEAFLFSYLFDYTERKRMENELRFSEEKFYSIFHHSPVALAVANSSGELIDVNETLVTLSGFKREDFIGNTSQSLGVYFDYHDRDQFFQDVKEQGFASYREV
jgi:PAS domain S-box-containing protein